MSQTIRIHWNAPTIDTSGLAIKHYKVNHNFPKEGASIQSSAGSLGGDSTVLIPGAETEITFKNVDIGEYYFAITVVYNTNEQNYSLPYIEYFSVGRETENGGVGYTVAPLYIAKGGTSNVSFSLVENQNSTFVIPSRQDWKIKGPQPDSTTVSCSSAIASNIQQDVTSMSSVNTASLINRNVHLQFDPSFSYILLDTSDTSDHFKLVRYKEELGVPFWYDTGAGEKLKISGTTSSFVTALTGKIAVEAGFSEVLGEGTAFTTELLAGDTLFYTSSASAQVVGKVANVQTDDKLILEQAYLGALSRDYQAFGRSNLRIDKTTDTIVATVAKTELGQYVIENYLTVDIEKEDAEGIQADSSKVLAQWNFDTVVNDKVTSATLLDSQTGTVIGDNTSILTDSPSGNAINFGGASYIQLMTDSNSYNWTESGGTFSIWLKSTITDGSGSNQARILNRDTFMSLRLDQSASTKQTVTLVNEATSSSLLAGTITSGQWTNIAVASNKVGSDYNYGLHIDSVLVDTISLTGANASKLFPGEGSDPGAVYTKALTLGGSTASGGSNYFKGAVTDLVLFKDRLKPGEVESIYAISGVANPSTINRPVIIGTGDNIATMDASGLLVGGNTFETAPFSVNITGSVQATAGKIADWIITASSIHAGTKTSSGYAPSGITLHASGSLHSPQFYIDGTGAFFKGTLSSSSGNIGGWNLNTSTMYAGDISSASAQSVTTGYINGLEDNEGALVFHSQGSLHSKNFFINSDGSASFKGDLDAATGTFAGEVAAGSIDADAVDFGSLNANSIQVGTLRGSSLSASAEIAVFKTTSDGTIISDSYAALTGKDENIRLHVGSISPDSSPFRVSASGSVTARDLKLYTDRNTLYFDSNTGGFTAAAMAQIAKALELRTHSFREDWTADFDVNQTDTFELITITENTTVNPMLQFTMRDFEFVSMSSANLFGDTADTHRLLQTPISFSASLASINNDFSATRTVSSFRIGSATGDLFHSTERPYFYKGEVGAVLIPYRNPDDFTEILYGRERRLKIGSTSGLEAIDGSSLVTGDRIKLNSSKDHRIYFRTNSSGTASLTINRFVHSAPFEFLNRDEGEVAITVSFPVIDFSEQYYKDELIKRTPTKITGSLKRSDGSPSATPTTIVTKTITNNNYTDSTNIADTFNYTYTAADFTTSLERGYYLPTAILQNSPLSYATLNDGYTKTVNAAHEVMLNRATQTLTSGVYYYHSTLSSTMGSDVADSATKKASLDSSRIFTLDADKTKQGFQLNVNQASQSSVDAALQTLDLAGDINAADGMTIDLSSGSGTLNINGNLNVTGTQTSTAQTDSVVTGKTITLSANAANAAQVNGAGLVVDRTQLSTGSLPDATILWDNTNSEWDIYERVSANTFRASVDGSQSAPAFTFGNRTKTGLFASDANAGDRINITTNDGSDNALVSFFDETGINSHLNVSLGTGGAFKNSNGNWTAQVISNDDDFDFKNASGVVSLHIDSGVSNVGIGTSDPTGKLTISEGTFTGMAAPSTSAKGLVIQDNTHTGISITTPADKTGSIVFNDTSTERGGMYYNHNSDLLYFKAGSAYRLYIDNSSAAYFIDTSASQGPTYSSGVLDLYQDHYGVLDNVEGSVLSFSTKGRTSSVRQTRAAIMAGPSTAGAGYGFLNILTAKTGNQSSGNATTPTVAVRTTESQGSQFQLGTNSSTTNLVTFNDTKHDSSDEDTIVSIEKSDADVGVQVGLGFVVGTGSGDAKIVAERNSSNDGQTDLVFITDIAGGGSLEAMRIVGNKTGINNADPKASLHVKNIGIDTQNSLVNSSDESVIATFSTTDFRSTKFMIQMEDVGNNNHLVSELLCVYEPNTQTAHATEYGVVFTGNEKGVIFNVDVSSSTVRLKATCDATSTTRRFTVATMSLAHTA